MKTDRWISRKLVIVANWILVALLVGSTQVEAVNYTIEKIGTFSTSTSNMNSKGQFAYPDSSNIWLYDNGNVKNIATNRAGLYDLRINDSGHVVWVTNSDVYACRSLYIYKDNEVSLITNSLNGMYAEEVYDINNSGQVAWKSNNGVFLYSGGSNMYISQFSGNGISINDKGRIVVGGTTWRSEQYDIYLWSDGELTNITKNTSLVQFPIFPKINNSGVIVWENEDWKNDNECEHSISIYKNGKIEKIYSQSATSATFGTDYYPKINAEGQVVWTWANGTDINGFGELCDIYLYNNGNILKLSDRTDWAGNINSMGSVVWGAFDEQLIEDIYIYSDGKITRLTYNADAFYPQINDIGQIIWYGRDGIYLATPKVEVAKQTYGICIGARNNQGLLFDARSDLAALKMTEQFRKLPNVIKENIIPIIGDNDTGGIQKSLIQANINYLKSKMQPGDMFFVYLTGHGNLRLPEYGGDAYVEIGPMPQNYAPSAQVPDWILTDSELYSYLQGIDDVSKWVIIDACHSGGFWGKNSEIDDGGLERLKNIALLVSAPADGYSDFISLTNYGVFTYALSWAFDRDSMGHLKADNNKDGRLAFEELYAYVKYWQEAYAFIGTEVTEMAFGDKHIFTMDRWNPAGTKNGDVMGVKTNVNITPIINYLLLD